LFASVADLKISGATRSLGIQAVAPRATLIQRRMVTQAVMRVTSGYPEIEEYDVPGSDSTIWEHQTYTDSQGVIWQRKEYTDSDGVIRERFEPQLPKEVPVPGRAGF
jgi:hypothetical protein